MDVNISTALPDSRVHVEKGLAKGYKMGFIASSDHLSTSASYAGVWSPKADREAIFRSLQAKRTFAATSKMSLIFRAGRHWMGETISATESAPFEVSVTSAGIGLKEIKVYANGKLVETVKPESAGITFERPEIWKSGGYIYVHVRLKDGNQAWSSPIWIEKE